MRLIGITGPSGSGKSAASEYLKKYDFKVIDADLVYHEIISQPSDCVKELVNNFGEDIISCTGGIDRPSLAGKVFGEENKEKLLLLNKITHKYVISEIEKKIKSYDEEGAINCVIDAPLLIEAGVDKMCDTVISVIADRDVRAKRISSRDGIDIDAAYKRIDSQKPDSFYKDHSDRVFQNNNGLDELGKQIDLYLKNRSII